MVRIGFHASHEQFKPSELLRSVQLAEQGGFAAAMCSDHFHPWSDRQGESGFAWSWLGAALQATSLSFGTVCAPGQRYHPAIIAQAAATLSEMFPGRFWIAVGSGEALNEHITGDIWPLKHDRNARLKEAAEVMRALWAGETVNHDGYFRVREARLYTRPAKPPLLMGAALTEETAAWMADWTDGLITAGASNSGLSRIVDAFRTSGGRGKPLALQSAVSFAATEEEALEAAHDRWRQAVLDSRLLENLTMPEEFDSASKYAPREALVGGLRISSDLQRHCDWLEESDSLGFDDIYVHYIGRDVRRFIDAFGEHVLPRVSNTTQTR